MRLLYFFFFFFCLNAFALQQHIFHPDKKQTLIFETQSRSWVNVLSSSYFFISCKWKIFGSRSFIRILDGVRRTSAVWGYYHQRTFFSWCQQVLQVNNCSEIKTRCCMLMLVWICFLHFPSCIDQRRPPPMHRLTTSFTPSVLHLPAGFSRICR